ncbi:hypothetical protein H0266_15295 [Halobacillus locisalis]|uniref:Lipoprotein n=1 Tax=Halobacillus locisalis TaxID=220753 RepID=A0A838CVT6_9BACI|nr:hypothetical protein [Halobacillus locisalis]MBA2176262.1 hypothetical protein [Halobacillus locisalis]
MRFLLCSLVFLLIVACENGEEEPSRISMIEKESNIAYVEELSLIAPKVCMENNLDGESLEPFLVDIKVEGELRTFVDHASNVTLDSRNFLQGVEDGSEPTDYFCTGNNLKIKKDISGDKLQEFIRDGSVQVEMTELDGTMIEKKPLTEFRLGKLDGSI